MLRKYNIIIFALLCCMLFGCTNHNNDNTMNLLTEPQKFSYKVSTDFYSVATEENHIEIFYPQFYHATKSCMELNLLVKNAISEYLNLYGYDVVGLTLTANYLISYADDCVISIVFHGESDVKDTAHPIQFAFAVNLLVTEPKKLEKSTLVNVNDKFAEDVLVHAKLHSSGAIKTYFEECTITEIKQILQHDDASFYLTEQGIGIIFPLPHPIGDYVELQITENSFS